MAGFFTRMFTSRRSAALAGVLNAHATVTFTLDGSIQDANAAFLDLTGHSAEELVGRKHQTLVGSNDLEQQRLWAALQSGQPQHGEFRCVTKRGEALCLQSSYCPVLGAGGKVERVILLATDVTVRRLQAMDHAGQVQAIRRSQSVITFSLDGIILEANANFLQAMGYGLAETTGQHHRIFMDPVEAAAPEYAGFWAGLGQGEFMAGKFRRLAKGGREVWVEATYNPILDDTGKPLRVVKYATNITAAVQRRVARSELTRAVDRDLGEVDAAMTRTTQCASSAVMTSRETAMSVQAVAAGAEELAASVHEISRRIAEASRSTTAATGEADRATRMVTELVTAAEKITQVVRLITDIAGQTNLLALNATIEAARAGDAGKGFAVVASEVKGLAGQTARATEEIAAQVGQVQNAVEGAVAAIASITAAIAQIDHITSEIAVAVEEQSSVTRDMSANMQSAAGAVESVNRTLEDIATAAANAERITRSAAENTRRLAG